MRAYLLITLLLSCAPWHCPSAQANGQAVASAPRAATTLTVVSFNVLADDLEQRIDEVAAYLAALQPDIACLQELHKTPNFERLRLRLRELGWPMEGRHALAYMGLFSRFPIQNYEALSDGDERRIPTMRIEHPVCGPLRVFMVHPVPGRGCTVVGELERVVGRYPEPRLLAGDFNLQPDADCLAGLRHDHIRACTPSQDPRCANTVNRTVWCRYHPEHCAGKTFGDAAIDHIFYQRTGPWRLIKAYCDHEMDLSDHFPVVAVFEALALRGSASGQKDE